MGIVGEGKGAIADAVRSQSGFGYRPSSPVAASGFVALGGDSPLSTPEQPYIQPASKQTYSRGSSTVIETSDTESPPATPEAAAAAAAEGPRTPIETPIADLIQQSQEGMGKRGQSFEVRVRPFLRGIADAYNDGNIKLEEYNTLRRMFSARRMRKVYGDRRKSGGDAWIATFNEAMDTIPDQDDRDAVREAIRNNIVHTGVHTRARTPEEGLIDLTDPSTPQRSLAETRQLVAQAAAEAAAKAAARTPLQRVRAMAQSAFASMPAAMRHAPPPERRRGGSAPPPERRRGRSAPPPERRRGRSAPPPSLRRRRGRTRTPKER